MKTIKLKVKVPDDDCKGCPYLKYHSKEVGYQQDRTWYTCSIFQCEITGYKRCVACHSCEVDE